MIRFLVILFISGLLVCAACFAVVGSMGWPKDFNFGHIDWTSGDENDGPARSLGAPGPAGTRELAWDGDESLTLNIPAEVTYTQGADAKVVITGPQNWIEKIEVSGGEIGLTHGRYRFRSGDNDGTIRIAVTAPNVHNFELNGAQDLKITGYDKDSLNLEVNGAARVRAAGRTKALTIEMNGASKAELADLAAEDADVELNGASSVVLAPTNSSSIEINGVGQAKLTTRPTTTHQEIHGFGSVSYGVARSDTDNDDDDEAKPGDPSPPAQPGKPIAPGLASPPAPPAPPAKPAPRAKTELKAA